MIKKFVLACGIMLGALSSYAALPAVTLTDINGKTVETAELSNDGKPMVISFFATWCKPCLRELKAIHEVYDEWQDETGVKLVAVSIDTAQDADKVKPLIMGKGWGDYEVLLDTNSEFKRQMGVNDVPHVFIVDGKGDIVWNHQGYVDGGEDDILEELQKLVK